jgi:hypothetical protein
LSRTIFVPLAAAALAVIAGCSDTAPTAPRGGLAAGPALARAEAVLGNPKFAASFTTCAATPTEIACDYKITGLGSTSTTAVTLSAAVLFNGQCRNKGGQIVEVKDFATTTSVTQPDLRPENGQLTGSISASLADASTPTARQVCPNGNWTIENPVLSFQGGYELFAVVSSGNAQLRIDSEFTL